MLLSNFDQNYHKILPSPSRVAAFFHISNFTEAVHASMWPKPLYNFGFSSFFFRWCVLLLLQPSSRRPHQGGRLLSLPVITIAGAPIDKSYLSFLFIHSCQVRIIEHTFIFKWYTGESPTDPESIYKLKFYSKHTSRFYVYLPKDLFVWFPPFFFVRSFVRFRFNGILESHTDGLCNGVLAYPRMPFLSCTRV